MITKDVHMKLRPGLSS